MEIIMYEFRDEKREITFDRYNPPTPWMNYLSNGTFHTMISQAGGGVAFYRSPQIWRINHYKFFHIPTDRSGFYTYIKDGDDAWCPTYEPSGTRPEAWKSTHGMGYTRFEASRKGVDVTANYFVGKYENALIWNLKLKSKEDKHVTLFAFVELGMMEFMRELQWQCYNKHQLTISYLDDCETMVYKYGVENQPRPEETPLVYFASDCPLTAFDGDRDEFIGAYRSEENPIRIEEGKCTNSTMAGGDPCFALQLEIDLKAGEEKEVDFFLGTGMTEADIRRSVAAERTPGFVQKSFDALSAEWNDYFNKFQCSLPDKDAERMVNIWNPYQAQRNFLFSRNISYYATGTFRGVGYRDTAQDVLAAVPFDLRAAKDKVKLLLSQQYRDGHVNHYFFPTEGWEPVTTVHSDDHLWTVMSVHAILMEEGSLDFLDETVEFYDGGEASIYEHLKLAIDFTEHHLGERGFPLMLRSDWNDQLFRVCREGKGESIWTSMQFGTVLLMMAEIAEKKGEDPGHYLSSYEEQKKLVNTVGWDGKWFRRCIMDNGNFVGTDKDDQAKIWLNAQTWAVISGMGERDKTVAAMDAVKEMLDTDLGIKKIHPSIVDWPSKEDPLTNYNPGTGENGAVFCHANTWAIIAECLLGRSERAYKYYHQLIPAVAQARAGEWRYKAEPYVYASNIFGPESDKFGLANVSWLSGTAAWMYLAVSQYMLGVKPVWEGLKLAPCLPEAWDHIRVTRLFRGCEYYITVKRGKEAKLTADGKEISGNVVPASGNKTCEVELVLAE